MSVFTRGMGGEFGPLIEQVFLICSFAGEEGEGNKVYHVNMSMSAKRIM